MKNLFQMKYRRALVGMFCVVGAFSPISDAFAAGSAHTETWNFGRFCRAEWDENGVISATADPAINTSEGSASFSDPGTGDLLIYFDGATIWDAAGAVVGTGLPGHPSSIHSGVIVPHPQVPNRVFVIGHGFGASAGVGYLEFDVSDPANVVSVGTNVVLDLDGGALTAREGMLVVPHTNGIDYWVVVSGDSAIFVVPVTTAGFGAVSKVTTDIPFSSWGLFAISNDGTSLVVSSTAAEIFQLDFDPGTGTIPTTGGVANKTQWSAPASVGLYGGAFSADDSKFYYSNLGNDTIGSHLFQYDVGAGVATILDTHPTRYLNSQTKLGPDGKMYVSTGISAVNAISVIDNPNNAAASITYTFGTVPMALGCDPVLGLPQTISPEATVTLGVEVTGPTGTIGGTTTTPSGTANLPDGQVISVEVTTIGGFSATCIATVMAAKWECAPGSISGLPYNGDLTITAQNGTTIGTNTFSTTGCGNGSIGTNETCDDANDVAGDGCSQTCNIEPGYSCNAGVLCDLIDDPADLDDDNDGILDWDSKMPQASMR